jgi:hypothetical protein
VRPPLQSRTSLRMGLNISMPSDSGPRTRSTKEFGTATPASICATGVIWGIDYLGRVGATKARFDFRPVLPRLVEANRAELSKYQDYAAHGSLLFGDLGTALLVMRLDPTSTIADVIYTRADANTTLPVRELMWGMPGSMIACCHMAGMTAQPRWRALFAIQTARLLGDLEETDDGPLWTQDLYGRHLRYLGPVHGYAGNMIALMRGWEWLTDDQRARLAEAVPRTLTANALRSELGASWRGVVADRDKPPADRDNYSNARMRLCQHCHGAPRVRRSRRLSWKTCCAKAANSLGLLDRSPKAPTSATARAAMAMRSSNFIVEPTI